MKMSPRRRHYYVVTFQGLRQGKQISSGRNKGKRKEVEKEGVTFTSCFKLLFCIQL